MNIETEVVDKIGFLWMQREPENRFNQEFLDDFNKALDVIENDKRAKAMIFSSRLEKYFCNGIDIPWAMVLDQDSSAKFLLTYVSLLHRLFLFKKPVVAAINGHAFAGGFFLAMCADWRVMREDRGWMCIPEVDLPFDLPPGHIALTAHIMGARNTDYASLSGIRMTSKQALRFHAIDEAVSLEQVMPKAIEMAELLGRKLPMQFERHKKHLRALPAKILDEEDSDFMKNLIEKINRLKQGGGK